MVRICDEKIFIFAFDGNDAAGDLFFTKDKCKG